MKILYAIQATGNGHISRAGQLAPYLAKYGKVDFLLSGTNSSLCPDFKVKYRFKGLSIFYNNTGGISFNKMWNNNSITEAFRNAYNLPVGEYDLIINDFDFITSLACAMRNVKSVQFGHQASFQSDKVPRPASKNIFYEFVLQHFAKATEYVGLHFQKYDHSIFHPVIKNEILEASIENKGHVTVYLPSVPEKNIVPFLKENKNIEFHLFSSERKTRSKIGNILYMPIDSFTFTLSMLDCLGVITGGGFETPSEVLYLNKKLMTVPIKNHYEQLCNAAALQKLGVDIEFEIKKDFGIKIGDWALKPNKACPIVPNNIPHTIEFVVKKGIRA
jgi:uncharacterized protein (TIGR00661 family)